MFATPYDYDQSVCERQSLLKDFRNVCRLME